MPSISRRMMNRRVGEAANNTPTASPDTPAASIEPQSATPAEPARRRSTVRERAPSAASLLAADASAELPLAPSADAQIADPIRGQAANGDMAAEPAAIAERAPEPEAEEAGKPRRTGWWAKRMFGKG